MSILNFKSPYYVNEEYLTSEIFKPNSDISSQFCIKTKNDKFPLNKNNKTIDGEIKRNIISRIDERYIESYEHFFYWSIADRNPEYDEDFKSLIEAYQKLTDEVYKKYNNEVKRKKEELKNNKYVKFFAKFKTNTNKDFNFDILDVTLYSDMRELEHKRKSQLYIDTINESNLIIKLKERVKNLRSSECHQLYSQYNIWLTERANMEEQNITEYESKNKNISNIVHDIRFSPKNIKLSNTITSEINILGIEAFGNNWEYFRDTYLNGIIQKIFLLGDKKTLQKYMKLNNIFYIMPGLWSPNGTCSKYVDYSSFTNKLFLYIIYTAKQDIGGMIIVNKTKKFSRRRLKTKMNKILEDRKLVGIIFIPYGRTRFQYSKNRRTRQRYSYPFNKIILPIYESTNGKKMYVTLDSTYSYYSIYNIYNTTISIGNILQDYTTLYYELISLFEMKRINTPYMMYAYYDTRFNDSENQYIFLSRNPSLNSISKYQHLRKCNYRREIHDLQFYNPKQIVISDEVDGTVILESFDDYNSSFN